MSFIAVAIGGASLLYGVGKGIHKSVKGNQKRRAGETAGIKASNEEMLLNQKNDAAQASQKAQMEGLAGQSMSQIANMQSKYDERAQEGLPDEIKEQYLENIQGSQAASLNAMGNRRGGLVGVSNVDQSAVNSYKELLSMDASQRLQNEQNAMSYESSMIGTQDQLRNRGLNFGIGNQQQNYGRDLSSNYADQDYAMALQGAGEQMTYDGMDEIGNSLGQTASFAGGGGFSGGANVPKSMMSPSQSSGSNPNFTPQNLQQYGNSSGSFGQQSGFGGYGAQASGFNLGLSNGYNFNK